jgi:hypothetical protein
MKKADRTILFRALERVAACVFDAAEIAHKSELHEDLRTVIARQEKKHRRFTSFVDHRHLFSISQAQDLMVVRDLAGGLDLADKPFREVAGLQRDSILGAALMCDAIFASKLDELLCREFKVIKGYRDTILRQLGAAGYDVLVNPTIPVDDETKNAVALAKWLLENRLTRNQEGVS